MQPMLSLMELPSRIEQLYAQSKSIGRSLMDLAFSARTPRVLSQGSDLVQLYPDAYVWVEKGVYKSFHGTKAVRWYSDADIVGPIPACGPDAQRRIVSDFGSTVAVFTVREFLDAIGASRPAFELLARLREIELEVTSGLCAAVIPDDARPDIACREFAEGAVIIREGDESREIYHMVDGNAVVTANGVVVGEIRSGEIFGEISFLTGELRSATVAARSHCLVQVMREEEFLEITKYRPRTSLEVSKTLARRLVDVNRKLIGGLT